MDENIEPGLPVGSTEDLSTQLHSALTIIFTNNGWILKFNRSNVRVSTISDGTLISLESIGPSIYQIIHAVLNYWINNITQTFSSGGVASPPAVDNDDELSSLLTGDDPSIDRNNYTPPIIEQPGNNLHSVNFTDENSDRIPDNHIDLDVDDAPVIPPESTSTFNIKLSNSTKMTIFYFLTILFKLISNDKAFLFGLFTLYCVFTKSNYDLTKFIEKNPFEKKKLYAMIFYILIILGIMIFIFGIYPDFFYQNGYYYFYDTILIIFIIDLQVKIFTVFLKTIITCLPSNICRKNNCYQIIECISQFYRATLPIYPWGFYIVNSANEYDPVHGGSTMNYLFTMMSLAFYVLIKIINIYLCGRFCIKSFIEFSKNMSCRGLSVNEERSRLWGSCPVCLEENKYLFLTSCKHKFCYPCISQWTSKERSRCPLCRKSIMIEYQNGFTTDFVQLF
ncbi:hypothetical protein HCN44_004980 [Aphidius gifuensis]|uniref:RING-type domain-containing protein n=1 Tax=Aphidius gifuensis TaxID=684658 RepID=A0A834XTS1_APHGI|nr:hypothetical protein HCN44_004980 [Aphidius gifuensis]